MKVYLTYATAFWREQGFSGAGLDTTSPLSIVYDSCTADGAPMLLVFIAGRQALEWHERSQEGVATCARMHHAKQLCRRSPRSHHTQLGRLLRSEGAGADPVL